MKAGDMTDGVFLIHIVDALQETVDFTAGLSMEKFLDSTLLIRAVTSSFEIAGEATKNLTQEFRGESKNYKSDYDDESFGTAFQSLLESQDAGAFRCNASRQIAVCHYIHVMDDSVHARSFYN